MIAMNTFDNGGVMAMLR
jgi:hypothetical protein